MPTYQQSTMHPAAYQVLSVLIETSQYHNKHYCYPNQESILKSLKLQFGRVVSRRTLNRYLHWLESHRFINRQRRHRRDPAGFLSLHSTLYSFTNKSTRFMRQLFGRMRQVIDLLPVTKMAQYNKPILGSQALKRPETQDQGNFNVDKHLKAIRNKLTPK